MTKEQSLMEYVIERVSDSDLLKDGASYGLNYMNMYEYEQFFEKWMQNHDVINTFDTVKNILKGSRRKEGSWAYTFFENLTMPKALEISRNIVVRNEYFPDDILYKGKSLCSKTGWPVTINPKYERVVYILLDIQLLIKYACDIPYKRRCGTLNKK